MSGMANAKIIGRRIAKLRSDRGETQEVTADATGISRSTLGNIETGGDAIGLVTAVALADYFKVPLDYLLCRNVPSGGPLVGKFVENRDELALLRFWGSLDLDERRTVTKLLNIPEISAA